MRSPLGSVLGHGAAKEGVAHWWAQRMTALALLPLVLWLVYSLLSMSAFDYNAVVEWMRQPVHAILLSLFLIMMFYHSYLGIQVVIEDYLHVGWQKLTFLIVSSFAHALLAATSIFVVLRISLGGPL